MRRRLSFFGVSLVALALAVTGAQAGPVSQNAKGDFAVIDVDVLPAKAGTKTKPQGVSVAFHGFYGNRSGGRSTPTDAGTIGFPAGMRNNGAQFGKCPLPKTAADIGKASRCGASSKVGKGTAEADARPTIPDRVSAVVSVFNGQISKSHPTLIIMAQAMIGATPVTAELDFEFRDNGGKNPRLVQIPLPGESGPGLFDITRIDIVAGRTIKRRGAAVSYLVAPITCRGSWKFFQALAGGDGTTLTARDEAGCSK